MRLRDAGRLGSRCRGADLLKGRGDTVRGSDAPAASLIAIVPVVVLFALIEKHLMGGLTSGAVK